MVGATYKFRIGAENIHGKGKPTNPSCSLTVPLEPRNGQKILGESCTLLNVKKSPPPFQQEIENLGKVDIF